MNLTIPISRVIHLARSAVEGPSDQVFVGNTEFCLFPYRIRRGGGGEFGTEILNSHARSARSLSTTTNR